MTVALLAGAAAAEVGPIFASAMSMDGNELVSSCRQGVLEQAAALRGLPDPEATVHFPIGDMPAAKLRRFRIVEMTLHAWDLARALEADERLPTDVVAFSLGALEEMAATVPEGMFGAGPSAAFAELLDDQVRLLDLSGRRPGSA